MPSHDILTTDSNGVTTFDYSDLNSAFTPAISALPLDSSPSDGTIYIASLVSADEEAAVVKVFATSAVTVAGVGVLSAVAPAAGVTVHCMLELN